VSVPFKLEKRALNSVQVDCDWQKGWQAAAVINDEASQIPPTGIRAPPI
jgi:hypothetical protein